ncbi:MAG: DMT family transporter [Rhodoferax sp.]
MPGAAVIAVRPERGALVLALGAIVLWGSLASLGVALAHVPPFLLTGLSLWVGALLALPLSRGRWQSLRVPWTTLALGVYGLFGYHLLLFLALRHAPAVQANLINYLWPLLIVVLAPLLLPGLRWRAHHVFAACLGFGGAALVILARAPDVTGAGAGSPWGYAAALAAALMWSTYSLLTRRVAPFGTAAIGSFAVVSGALALACHALWEPTVTLSLRDGLLIAAMGLGPMGGAFFLWDAALKRGDARHIGVLSYLTPLLSTTGLLLLQGQWPTPSVVLAGLLILGAAAVGTRG